MSDDRMASYKNKGKDFGEMRRKRSEVTVELRKCKKDEELLKLRNIKLRSTSSLQENKSPNMTLEQILAGIASDDDQLQMCATFEIRKLINEDDILSIGNLIKGGILKRCVEFLSRFDNPTIQFESSWMLSNIASSSSENTKAVVAAGAVPKLIALISSPQHDVVEQAIWALGNIAADGPVTRDLILQQKIVPLLLQIINQAVPINILCNSVWALSNLCRHKNPSPNFSLLEPSLPFFAKLLHSDNIDIVADSCWALANLTDGPQEQIQAILDTGLIKRLVQLLNSTEIFIVTPALRSVGNIISGTDEQTDMVIKAGVLPYLKFILKLTKHPNLVREAAWVISNITAGTVNQIQAVIDAELIEPIIEVLANGDFKSQKEAAWVISNYTNCSTPQRLGYLIKKGVLKPFCKLLKCKDVSTINIVLNGIINIFNVARNTGEEAQIALKIEEVGGLENIEALLKHKNEDLYNKALEIMEKYFSGTDETASSVSTNTGNDVEMQFPSNECEDVPEGGFSF